MPELPQIGQNAQVNPPGIVPVEPSKSGSEMAETGAKVSAKANELLNQAITIRRYQQFHGADADFITGSAALEDQSRAITDPQQRKDFIMNGAKTLQQQIVQKYPGAGVELGPQLATRMSELQYRATMAAVAQTHENTVAGLTTGMKQTAVAFASAKDDRDAAQIMDSYNSTVDIALKHGAISLGDAAKYKYEAKYAGQMAVWGKQVSTDPLGAIGIPLEKSGLNAEDYFTWQSRAQREINRQNDTAEDLHRGMANKAGLAVLTGTASDADVTEGNRRGLVSNQLYEYHFGHKPFDAGAANHAIASLDAMPVEGRSTNSLDHFWANYKLTVAPYTDSATNSAVEAKYKVEREEAATDEGKLKNTLIANSKSILEKNHPDATGFLPDPEEKRKLQEETAVNIAAIRGAKTIPEAHKVYDDLIKKYGNPNKLSDKTIDAIKNWKP
jgi:hypothetical protein